MAEDYTVAGTNDVEFILVEKIEIETGWGWGWGCSGKAEDVRYLYTSTSLGVENQGSVVALVFVAVRLTKLLVGNKCQPLPRDAL